jgi:cell division protein FtsL
MSAPAPAVRPQPVRRTPRPTPERVPAARPSQASPSRPRRARRGSTPAFWIFTALVVTGMVVGIVSVSALLVQASFRVDAVRERMAALAVEQEILTMEVAELSSPGRVQRWARGEGMVMPENVVILRVAATSPPEAASG